MSWLKEKNKLNLDLKLVKKVNANFWPDLPQLKYIGRFLNDRERRAIKISVFLIALALLVFGTSFVINNNVAVPAAGGEYSEALVGQPKFVNPLFAPVSDVDADLAYLVYSGLFRFDAGQKLTPDLATSYTVGADGLTYDIGLRQDAKWSDGEPFTASDVVYTFETILDPEVNSPLYAAFGGIKVEQTDDYSVRFTLKEPYAPFLNSLTVGILPQHIWSDVPPTSIKLAKNNLQPVGSGPWKFNKLTKDDAGNILSFVLDRNDNYYGAKPYLKTLTFKFYADQIQAVSAVKIQEVMAMSFLPKDKDEKIPEKNYNFYNFKLPQYTAIFFNQEANDALADAEVREALGLAIDKKNLVGEVLENRGEPINSPFLPGYIGYNSGIKYAGFDLNKANQLLDKKWQKIQPEEYYKNQYEAALKDRKEEIDAIKNNASTTPETVSSTIREIEKEVAESVQEKMNHDQPFYRKNKSGDILSVTITTADTNEYKNAAEYAAKMWRAAGAQTDVELVSGFQLTKETLKSRGYQTLLYGEIIGNDPDPYPFWHSSQITYPGLNLSMFVDRNADKLLEEARGNVTITQREELYKKFQEILTKEKPAIFLYAPTYDFAISKNVKGVFIGQIFSPSERYAGMNEWYMKTKRKWNFSK